ncbi:MAG: peptide chain release factor-like protein [Candidatus Omnitrophota bacterium]
MKYGVSLRKETELKKKMRRFGVKEKDITENFIRSSGRGGQNVNKVATCVYLKHKPSGVEVKCKQARTQALNRFIARRILVEKIETKTLGKLSAEKQRIEKIRRQKRKRSKRAKEKILADKKKQAQKKNLRKSISAQED